AALVDVRDVVNCDGSDQGVVRVLVVAVHLHRVGEGESERDENHEPPEAGRLKQSAESAHTGRPDPRGLYTGRMKPQVACSCRWSSGESRPRGAPRSSTATVRREQRTP